MSEETQTAVIENALRQINLSGAVAKGIKCTTKAIMKGRAQIVFLAEDCENKDYRNLITGLCKKYNVKLHTVAQKEMLGKALGLTNMRAGGTVRRQMGCGACAIVKYGSVKTQEINDFRAAFDPED